MLFVLGAVPTWKAWPRRRLTTAGLGYILVGVHPESVNMRMHLMGASNLLTANFGLLLLGLTTRGEHSWRARLALGLAGVAVVALVSGPLLLARLQHGGGLGERLVLYPAVIYVIAVAAWLFAYGRTRLADHPAAPQ